MLKRTALTVTSLILSVVANGELLDLTESEMSDVSGEGIGLVYEDYQCEMKDEVLGGDAGNAFKISDEKAILPLIGKQKIKLGQLDLKQE